MALRTASWDNKSKSTLWKKTCLPPGCIRTLSLDHCTKQGSVAPFTGLCCSIIKPELTGFISLPSREGTLFQQESSQAPCSPLQQQRDGSSPELTNSLDKQLQIVFSYLFFLAFKIGFLCERRICWGLRRVSNSSEPGTSSCPIFCHWHALKELGTNGSGIFVQTSWAHI